MLNLGSNFDDDRETRVAETASAGLERRIAAEIERRRDALVDLLARLIAFDTRAPGPDLVPRDEAALQAYLADRLRAAGLTVDVWEPDAAALPATGHQIPPRYHFRGRPQLVARAVGRGGGRSLLLNGHVDVVTPEPREEWTTDPFAGTVRDGRVYGRGACDMKGSMAAMLAALSRLRENPRTKHPSIVLACTVN